MAGKVQGYSSIKNRYKVCAIGAVGMGQTGTQVKEIRKKNDIPESTPLFTLQGNFNLERLHGLYKIMMNIMIKTVGNALEKKENKTIEEEDTPNFEAVLQKLQERKYKHVHMYPLMVVAGDHANNDMYGDEEDSWKTQIEALGIKTTGHLCGLGRSKAIQAIYIQHVLRVLSL